MSHVAADFPTQASNTTLSKAGRQSQATQKAPSGQFDDLLNAIPDAPPEPRDRAAAPERPRPAETRAERSERPQRAERPARSESRAPDQKVPATDATAPKEAAPAESETTVPAQATGTEKPAKAGETDAQTADSEAGDTSATPQAAVNALVTPATVIDPAAVAPAAEVSLDGEPAAKAGVGKADITAVTNAAVTATRNAEQQSAVLTDQTTGLTAEDADVLAALAVTAAKNVKDGQGDKTPSKAEGDKAAPTAKLTGETAPSAATAATGAPAQVASGEGDTAGAKPVQSELAKVGVEHQRGQGDTNARPGAEQAAPTATTNTATVKTPDMFATHLLSPTSHTAQAAAAVSGPAQSPTGDKAVPMADVGIEITAKIASGRNQFDIRLDPAELGRIHVKVNVDRDGNITTHMMADRPETLDLLRRDTQGLERALQDAGLKTSDNSLQFSLRDQTQQQQQQNQNDGQASRLIADDEATTTLTTTVIARDYGRYGARPSGLDIRV